MSPGWKNEKWQKANPINDEDKKEPGYEKNRS